MEVCVLSHLPLNDATNQSVNSSGTGEERALRNDEVNGEIALSLMK